MNQIVKNSIICLIAFLLLLAWWSSLTIGLSSDEYFHHANGLKRFNYLISLGEDRNFQFRNNEFYPGLYDTLSHAFGQIILAINKKFYANNIDFVMHLSNIITSSLSILGLYLLTKKFFNQNIALLAVLLTLLNPFFFGHMGMNSKDVVVFFSLIWFSYYFYNYCTDDKKIFKNLFLFSFFIGFGCGVRLTFLVVIFPVVVCGLIYLFNKFKGQYLYLAKRLSLHFIFTFIITVFLVILCWPHMIVEIQNGNFIEFFTLIVDKTINWIDGPKIGFTNGEFYEVFNTPKSYFLDIIIYRLPIYFSVLMISSYFLILINKNFFQIEIKNFMLKFLILNFIALFPIILALILSVNLYDNLRLFLFVVPFFCMIAAFSLHYLVNSFKNSWKIKSFFTVVFILFSLSFYRFVLLTPYQYDYINYSTLKFKDAEYKWEHDYWGTSYKELVLKIKNKYSREEIQDMRFANCSGDDTLLYYLYRHLGKKFIYVNKRFDEANYMVIINRATLWVFNNPAVEGLVDEKGIILLEDMERVVRAPGAQTTCNELYPGEDVLEVSRNGLTLSTLRKLSK